MSQTIDRPSVAFVDDDETLRDANRQTLDLAGFTPMTFPDGESALAGITAEFPGVVVTDIRMPGMGGLELFRRLRAMDPDLPVILVTGHGDVAMAVDALREGAYDFIAKPYATDRLVESVRRATEKRRLVLENRQLRALAERAADDDMPLIGESPGMERLRRTLRQIADADVDVLVEGETGSGKEVVASLLHRWSRRAPRPFVALNCGALPETVIESELFGHEAGAFTGALKKRVGRIEHSSGGTLFLDEIESMPPALQVKLLRVLETREVEPLGTNQRRAVDLRVVAAAKVDLGDPTARGYFREDLFYRLNVVTVRIPPLRERRDDVPLLFAHFLARAAERFRRELPPLSSGVARRLATHLWPGNVRELSHYAERVALGLGEDDADVPAAGSAGLTLPERVDRFEAGVIRETLANEGGDVRRTIEALGLPRKTFYDKLQRHGISRRDFLQSED
ncbi:sigma-54 dependent transcriptional regulator [Aureimonas sp. AU12]|uniref:sigma-54-dependent transcriptional regulator n=1 Tax=Aureimonas sp. AU12 TaxID=1638161 RepID=UPI0007811CF5|nr:sigma-54 dependent transcriptional regulator [Aureimonas sp. AU12]